MASIELKIDGIAPFLMHNGRLADQLNPIVRELKNASKSTNKNTEMGQLEISRLEFIGSTYWREGFGFYIPGVAFERALRDGSAGVQRGLKKKFDAGVQVLDDAALVYDGDYASPDALFASGKYTHRCSARVVSARIQRTRPCFQKWGATFTVNFTEELIDKGTLLAAVQYAGNAVGLGDWRPRFGRFTVSK
jgi:hypothetical protein